MSTQPILLPVKNLDYVSRSSLMRLIRATPAIELTWMNRVACEWFMEKAPHDNYGKVQVRTFKVGPYQRQVQLPIQAVMRTLKIAYVTGNHTYSLTVDSSLKLPDSIEFECDPHGGMMDWTYPFGGSDPLSLRPTLAYNANYYRYNDGMIIFNSVPADGYLVVEYLGNGDAVPQTVIHAGYIEPLRNYLIWQYHENKGNYNKAADFERKYDESMTIANVTVKCPKLDDILDIIGAW